VAAEDSAEPAPPPRPFLKRPLVWIILLLLLIAAGGYGAYWWTTGRFFESTDDAYLQADQVTVAPRVSGYVSAVLVADNQAVTAGEPLVRIDPENYRATLTQQVAAQDARSADVSVAEAQLQQQVAGVDQARARLKGDQVDAAYAAHEATRYRGLAATGAEPQEKLAQMVNQRDRAQATVAADTAALAAAEGQVETTRAQIVQARAQAEGAQASVASARLDVAHTEITASIAGRVGDRTVRVGQYVQPGTRLLTLVPVQNIYVTANFKETQLARLRIGQHARVSVDALGGRSLDAVVQSMAPGTGAQFSILPPTNATGNFTKIVQRVPVRLRLDVDDETKFLLVPGLSATVTIDTAQKAGDRA